MSRIVALLGMAARGVIAASLLVVAGAGLARVFNFSQQPDYGEGTVLAMVERMGHEPISPAWLRGPVYTFTSYGPAYYWAVRAASAVLPWQHGLVPGRLVSLLASWMTAALILMVVRRQTQSVELGMLAAMVFLGSPVAHAWATPYRVDPLAVLLAVASYAAIGNAGGQLNANRRALRLASSAALIAAGSLVKPTVALAALPVFLVLLLEKRWRAAMVYAVLTAGLGIAAWAVLNWATQGYFFAAAVRGNLGSMSPRHGFWSGHAFLTTPLAVAAGITVAWLLVKEPRRLLGSVFALGFLASTLLTTVLAAREGSSQGYFLEASALGSLVIGLYGLPALWSLHRGRALAAGALLAMLLAAPELRGLGLQRLDLHATPYGAGLVSARLGPPAGTYVLADGQYLPAVLHAGWTPLLNDPFYFHLQVENGGLKPDLVVQAMERGEVQYLVLKRPIESHLHMVGTLGQKWPPDLLRAMQRRYRLKACGEECFIYEHCRRR